MKRVLTVVVAFLPLAAMWAMSAPSFADGQTHKLRLALYIPDTPGPDPDSIKWWLSEVEKRSQGRIKISSFWGGGLLKASEIISGVQSGVVDMGFTSWGYFPDEYLVLLPGGGPNKFHYESAPAILQAWLQLYEEFPQYPEAFNGKNQKLLFHVAFASNELVARKPIESLADLKGMKSRAGGKYEPKIMEAAGCVSVRTSITEAYDALQKGLIDVCLTSFPFVKQYKFHEIAKYVSIFDAGPTDAVAAFTINKNSWDKLPKDLQDVLTQVSTEHFKVWAKMHYDYMAKAEQFMRSQGMTISTFPRADREKWRTSPAVTELTEQYIAALKAKGLPGKQINDRFLALEETMEAKYGPKGTAWK